MGFKKRLQAIWVPVAVLCGLLPSYVFAGTAKPASGCVATALKSLVAPEKELEGKIRRYLDSLATDDPKRPTTSKTFGPEFKHLFSQAETPEDILRYWRSIERLAQIEYVTAYGSFKSRSYFFDHLRSDLSSFDSVKPVLALRDRFTPSQKKEFLAILDRIDLAPSQFKRGGWSRYIASFHMIFDPDASLKYLKNVSDGQYAKNYAEQNHMYDFHEGTITAFNALPEKTRILAKAAALKGYREAQSYGKLRMEDFGLPEDFKKEVFDDFLFDVKQERRNWETVHRALTEPEFQSFFAPLKDKAKIRLNDLNQEVKKYWASLGFSDNGYSFDEVYSVAKKLQKGPLAESLKKEDLLLYGSFPNGKAALGTSDIDIHPSRGLMNQYFRAFKDPHTRRGSFAQIANKPDGKRPQLNAPKMSEQLLKAERDVAEALQVKVYEPAELMTMVLLPPPQKWEKDFFRKEMIGQYNPLSVRVTKTKIFLEVYDAYSTQKQLQIEILP